MPCTLPSSSLHRRDTGRRLQPGTPTAPGTIPLRAASFRTWPGSRCPAA